MIEERDIARLLRAATDDIAIPVAPARELAAAGYKRRHRRRVIEGAAAAALLVALSVALPAALSSDHHRRTVTSADSTERRPSASCADRVPSRVLPRWARAGFTGKNPRAAYVLGQTGEIAAILFAQPLTAPPSADHNNKILWVSRIGDGSQLRITATLQDGSATARRVVAGGPGPSIIDLPAPGCWHMTLRWAGVTDTLDLAYRAP